MDFSSFQIHELIALSRALHFVKLRSRGDEAYEIAASSIVADIYAKATEAMWQKTASSESSKYFVSTGWPYVDNDFEGVETIKYHIAHVMDWNYLSEEIRLDFIKNIIFPLNASESFISDMIAYGNSYHNNVGNL